VATVIIRNFKDGFSRMTTPTLDVSELTRRKDEIEVELRTIVSRRLDGGAQPLAAALKETFIKLFGDTHSSRNRVQFFLFIAPQMRRLTIEATRSGRANGTVNLSALDLEQWLARLEGFDPECARMIDLRYFSGLSTRETAAALGLSPQAVIRDLRFAKAWLQARVRWSNGVGV
jgi:DNA-directed RNA polymerase specialized sigma24 family protein